MKKIIAVTAPSPEVAWDFFSGSFPAGNQPHCFASSPWTRLKTAIVLQNADSGWEERVEKKACAVIARKPSYFIKPLLLGIEQSAEDAFFLGLIRSQSELDVLNLYCELHPIDLTFVVVQEPYPLFHMDPHIPAARRIFCFSEANDMLVL